MEPLAVRARSRHALRPLEAAMLHGHPDRRDFIKAALGSAAVMTALPAGASAAYGGAPGDCLDADPQTATRGDAGQAGVQQSKDPILRFAVIGINHGHVNAQTNAILRARGELVWLYAKEPDLVDAFRKQFPQAKLARSEAEVLEDPSIKLVVSAAIPDERAPLGIRVMQHGKDYMADKPGITTLNQLAEARRVQAETKRIYSIMYSERLENRATVKAGELVKAGAIGRVVQTIGLGPHRMNPKTRPAWFFERARYGGILCDLASHQADQFLFFTGSTQADVAASQVGNLNYPQYPGLEDFGDMMVRGNGGAGYVRVDWFTPGGLATWGDGRLTILGTDGFIEIRKNVDIAGRPGGSHLFLVDQKETRYIDTSATPLPYGEQLVADVLNRTETAMPQAHCFLAMELVLKAQAQAQRVSFAR
jgi:predicted dehydrogenase